jgi:leucyl-tRNA synthetase
VGWDSFGLPAENYAIKIGVSPQESIPQCIAYYQKQYTAMGWGVDWDKEIDSSEPIYYKWTQWIFSELYRHGLVYQDARMQWWCEQCQTVLANEQVDSNGKCWRHDKADDPVIEKKEVNQWFFKITAYADELLEATDDLNWTPGVKLAQKNWIGKSIGAEVKFLVKDSKEVIPVFTTAHDTIYGVTFMVLAPEHELIEGICSEDRWPTVNSYIKDSLRKSEVERQASKDKGGVFTGAYAINPINGKEVPIWVADYVLAGYGTGAIMAVPGEDSRDYEFANKHGLDIVYTTEQQEFVDYSDIKSEPTEFKLANSGEFNGQNFKEARKSILKKLTDDGFAEEKVNYKMRDWSVARQRYWGAPIPIIILNVAQFLCRMKIFQLFFQSLMISSQVAMVAVHLPGLLSG